MVDKKTFAYSFVGLFILLTYYLWKNNDIVAQTIANDGIIGIFWYFISNASYVFLLVSLIMFNTEVNLGRNVLGALLLIFAIDIISYPRVLTSGFSPNDAILASSDGLVIQNILKMNFSFHSVHTFYYLVLPIILIFISLQFLGISNFYKKLTGGT